MRPLYVPSGSYQNMRECNRAAGGPPAADEISTPETCELSDEEAHLVGHARNFVGRQGEPMYVRARANRGSQLRRIGATDHCSVCGMPALPRVTAIAHIHNRDLRSKLLARLLVRRRPPARVWSSTIRDHGDRTFAELLSRLRCSRCRGWRSGHSSAQDIVNIAEGRRPTGRSS
jgi:hypothetical protein